MRQCRLNFAENRYDCEAGIIGEHYATELIVTPPAIMPTEAVYRLCFEPGGLSEIILQTTDGAFSYPLPSAVTATPYCCVTLIGYVGSEQIYKSRMVRLHFSQTADGDSSIDPQQPGIVDEVNQNTAARHSHANKAVLDLLSKSNDGNLQFDGKKIGGGSSSDTYIVNMTVGTTDDTDLPIQSCDSSFTKVDGAYKSGNDVVVKMTGKLGVYTLPLILRNDDFYGFAAFVSGQTYIVSVTSDNEWEARQELIGAASVAYENAALKNVSNVGDALNAIAETQQQHTENIAALDEGFTEMSKKAHTHDNKSVLDLISAADGKLRYNGSDVGLKGEKGDKGDPGTPGAPGTPGSDASVTKANVVAALGYTPQAVSTQVTAGTEITLADNTEYRLTDVTTLTLTYPTGNFECWLKLTFAASGSVTVTLPTGTRYIGSAPSFANGETWEMSIKDGVVIAQKVGDGT